MPIAVNDRGDVLFRGQQGSWEPARIAENDAGDRLAYDGQGWVAVPRQPSMLDRAVAPIKNIIPDTAKYAREGIAMIGEGLSEARPGGERMAAEAAQKGYSLPDYNPVNAISSVGKTALGALGYATAPISGAINALIGRPVEQNTGIPAEYTNFAASLVAPEVIPYASAAARKVVSAGKALAPDVRALKDSASSLYNSPAVKDTTLAPQSVGGFYGNLANDLETTAKTTADLAPSTFKTVDRFANRFSGGAKPVSIDDLRNQREIFGNIISDNLVSNPQEARAAKAVVKRIDDYLEKLPAQDVLTGSAQDSSRALKQANAEYSAAKSAETLNERQFKAELRAAAAGSGMNVGNTMRQRMIDIVTSPKLARGFSQPELSYMERIAFGSPVENTLRAGSNVGGGGGGHMTGVAAGTGYALAGPAGAAAVPAVGIGMKMLSNRMTVNNVRKLNDLVRSDSPTGKAMQNALKLWGNSSRPSQGGVNSARSAVAAQKVEELLRKSGIELKSPIPAAADTEPEQP